MSKDAHQLDCETFITPPGQVVRARILEEVIYFTVTNEKDEIQKYHAQGHFYEEEELDIIKQYFKMGGVYCDIGTNIGNHTLFALKYLRAKEAILFEPNPTAIDILKSNLILNNVIHRCDLRNLGVGLSDAAKEGLGVHVSEGNLGGAQMIEGGGTLKVIPGDLALAGRHIDFMKIDVEGMEMKVLRGLSATINACRPRIFIEVDRQNRREFRNWVAENNYEVKDRFSRYRRNENFMLVPAALAADGG